MFGGKFQARFWERWAMGCIGAFRATYLAREGSAAAEPDAIPEERRLAVLLVFHLGQLHLPLAHLAVTSASHCTVLFKFLPGDSR